MYRARIVLAVTDDLCRRDLKAFLTRGGYFPVGEAVEGSQALRVIRSTKPDLAVLEGEMAGLSGLEVARIITEDQLAPVLLVTTGLERGVLDQVDEFGVYGYLVKPVTEAAFLPALEAALANYQRYTRLEKQLIGLKRKAASKSIIEKAKLVLMKTKGLSEPEAHRWLQKQSMNACTSIQTIAEGIIRTYEAQVGKQPG